MTVESRPEHARILVVDDEEINVRLLEGLLHAEGFLDVVSCTDSGRVEELYRNNEFDLLILDLNMPSPDGFELMARLAPMERDGYLPILVISAANDQQSRRRALQSGAKDFVSKPFDRVEVISRIRNMLEVRFAYKTVRDLHLQLASDAQQLRAVNDELESFGYSVAHDLKSPLRRIDGFTAMLEQDAATLSDDNRLALARIREQVRHMAQLIDGLLKLSRIARDPLNRTQVDLAALARQIVGGLRNAEPGREVEFQVDASLPVAADPNLLHAALSNLLGNAWKYTRNKAPARIEFGQAVVDGAAVFYVKDNGAGFDMQYADRIFAPFQRLHSPQEFEGTGIGLAIVDRVVKRHGGRTWAEAAPDQGATFYFSLPQKAASRA